MNGSSTRIFQNVRYDLVLNDDNPNDYYFEPSGPLKNPFNKYNNAWKGLDKNKPADEEKAKANFAKATKLKDDALNKRWENEKKKAEAAEEKRAKKSAIKKEKKELKRKKKEEARVKKEKRKKEKKEAKVKKEEDDKIKLEKNAKDFFDSMDPPPENPLAIKDKIERLFKNDNNYEKIKKEAGKTTKEKIEYLNRRLSNVSKIGRALGTAGSKAFKGGKAIGKYAKGITTAQNNYNNVKIKSKHVEGLSEIEKFEKEKLREKVKEIKMLEKIIFKLSGQPSATRKRLNKLAKGASKGLKIAGKGLFKLGKKGIGFLNKIPGSKVGFGSSMRSMGKGFKMGSKGARAGIKRLKTFGGFASKGAGAGIRRLKTIGGGGAKLALKGVKAASKAAAATAAAIAAKTKTPVNDEPGLVCWNFTNLPPCLCLKIFAPVLCCTFLTEEKAKEQAKRLT